jgi:hypothetical protein
MVTQYCAARRVHQFITKFTPFLSKGSLRVWGERSSVQFRALAFYYFMASALFEEHLPMKPRSGNDFVLHPQLAVT